MEQYLKEGRHLKTVQTGEKKSTHGGVHRTAQKQTRSNTQASGKKLFAQEFYNLKKKTGKRDLRGISLHNHPDGYVEGIFSKWKASGSNDSGSTKGDPSPLNKQR